MAMFNVYKHDMQMHSQFQDDKSKEVQKVVLNKHQGK